MRLLRGERFRQNAQRLSMARIQSLPEAALFRLGFCPAILPRFPWGGPFPVQLGFPDAAFLGGSAL